MCCVALPDNAHALERERVIDCGDVLGAAGNKGCESAGRDGLEWTDLRLESLEDAIHQSRVAVVEAALDAVHRVGADHASSLADINARQTRSAREECFGRNSDAGSDDATEIFALGGDDVEGGCCSEV